jgi:hypothetical protein
MTERPLEARDMRRRTFFRCVATTLVDDERTP